MEKKISIIMFHCGYVENCKTSAMIYTSMAGYFPTEEEAVKELVKDFYSKFKEDVLDRRIPKNKCCESASILGMYSQESREKYKFCSTCGTELQERSFDEEEFMDYITNLHDTTCDSYGNAEYGKDRNLVWWPYDQHLIIGAPKESVLYIPESAEVVFRDALYEVYPELIGEEYEGRKEFLEEENKKHPKFSHKSDWENIKEGKSLWENR